MDALATRPTRAKAGARPDPVQSEDYAHLSLEELRACRGALQDEESKVSYWRRIIQARLDVVRSGNATATGSLDAKRLAPVLSEQRVSAGRTALVRVLQTDDIPPLPKLGELWERQVDEDDPVAMSAFEHDLDEAEQQLSTYRNALHTKLAESTGQLIARYRDTPDLALTALPLQASRRSA